MATEKATGIVFSQQEVEDATGKPYIDVIQERTSNSGLWDYLAYDEEGNLAVNNVPIMALVERCGTPLEIVDTTIIEKRTQQWKELVNNVATRVGYTGQFEYFYASKANMSAEITLAAYRSGWQAETSSAQDIVNLNWLHERGLISKDLKIICNGYKLPPERYSHMSQTSPSNIDGVEFVDSSDINLSNTEMSYADYILQMNAMGFNITPILDTGEVEHFANAYDNPMDVGLRLKFGRVTNDADLSNLVSRHGMRMDELEEAAQTIDKSPHLNLKMLHAMVGAAQTIPVDIFVDSLLFAADKYFELKKQHPSLSQFNVGGGMPPLGTAYDHEGFLETLMSGMKRKAEESGMPLPDVVFEFGNFIAAESGFHVFKILQNKQNNTNETGLDEWAVVDGGLMAAIPDMLLIGKTDFPILAANNAKEPAKSVRLGDLTCDTDGRFPPQSMEQGRVLIPDTSNDSYIVICNVGAYQEILAGIRGAHHCGLLEAAEAIIVENNGAKKIYTIPRQTSTTVQDALGYSDASLNKLKLFTT